MLFKWHKTFVVSLSTVKISEKYKILKASRKEGLNGVVAFTVIGYFFSVTVNENVKN